jgi:archaemetzincin
MKIAILQVGSVEQKELKYIKESILRVLPNTESVIIGEAMMLPQEAYNRPRKQYNSSLLLKIIRKHLEKARAEIILGITDDDLYVPKLNFVFGQAELSGKAAVISLRRLKPEIYGEPTNQTLYLERAAKEAVHEIGHVIGLPHCPNPLCVMSFSNDISAVDKKKRQFCPECTDLLSRLVL